MDQNKKENSGEIHVDLRTLDLEESYQQWIESIASLILIQADDSNAVSRILAHVMTHLCQATFENLKRYKCHKCKLVVCSTGDLAGRECHDKDCDGTLDNYPVPDVRSTLLERGFPGKPGTA